MHAYRTHTCGALRPQDINQTVRLSGWVHRIRDHGNLIFIDLRDHYGITQCLIEISENKTEVFKKIEQLNAEDVITITGTVLQRSTETVNTKMPTGDIEVQIQELSIQSAVQHELPIQVNSTAEFP